MEPVDYYHLEISSSIPDMSSPNDFEKDSSSRIENWLWDNVTPSSLRFKSWILAAFF